MMPPRKRSARVAAAILLVAIAALPSTAFAAEWYVESRLQTQLSYDSNLRLSPDDEISTFGGALSPELRFGRRTEALDLSLFSRTDFNGYTNDTSLSSVDQKVAIDASYLTQLGKFGLTADYVRDTTLVSEVTDTGDLTEAARVERVDVLPSWSYELTERDTLDLGAGFLQNEYHTDSLTDYQFYTGQAGWTHELSEITSLQTVGYYGHYVADDSVDTRADIYGMTIGATHQFSEQFSVQAAAGPEYVVTKADDFSGGRDTETDLGYRLDLGITYLMDELTRLEVTGSRKTEPSGSGDTVTRDRVAVALTRQITELFSLRFDGAVLQNDSTSTGNLNRLYYQLQPSAIWRLDRDWDLNASYRFRSQDFDDRNTADSHAVFLTVTYRLPRWSWTD